MQVKEVEALITALVEPILADTEMTLVDVEYVREKDWYLRIFIDKPGGVEIDDCQLVSEQLTAVLDAKDPIPDKYFLEVSSPGIERVLRTDAHIEAFTGAEVEAKLFAPVDGKKTLRGILGGIEDGRVILTVGDTEYRIEHAKISRLTTVFDF